MTFEEFNFNEIPRLLCLQKNFELGDTWEEFSELIDFDRSEPRYNYGAGGRVTSFEIDVECSVGLLYSSIKTIKASDEETWVRRNQAFAKSEIQRLALFFCEHIVTPHLQSELKKYQSILKDTLNVNDALDWKSLLQKQAFDELPPTQNKDAQAPPKPSFEVFDRNPSFLERLFGQTQKILEQSKADFANAIEDWESELEAVAKKNQERHEAFENALSQWESRRADFEAKQGARHKEAETFNTAYVTKDSEAIEKYCTLVLERSRYPRGVDLNPEVAFQDKAKKLVVEIKLPTLDQMPTDESCTFSKASSTAKGKPLSEKKRKALHESVVMQICIRTMHEVFEADVIDAIHSCALNGYMTVTDAATGHSKHTCVVTVQCHKQLFESFDLAKVDPLECFKKLKGVNGIGIKNTVAVAPTAQLSKDDNRFVGNVRVVEFVSEETNLAAMDWEEFEHLVRELFEKEFASVGSEVRVTQASADGGVDAVVFDPDPIRGGKIVIQAKRYTNTVGVAAVRDLYGTLMNEGAMKGILVTTSDFGPDSHAFAVDKPLTLINGANLLHLLAKHGHQATIDLEKAKLQRGLDQS